MPAEKIVSRGVCQIPKGRQLFPTLSVEDNLLMGASGKREWQKGYADDLAYVYELFPVLGERRKQLARTLSGGEQQMLAIGRGLMAQPSLLLLDEPSMGLAPIGVERIFDALTRLNAQGLTMLMVEQNAEMALSLADRVMVIQTGLVVLDRQCERLEEGRSPARRLSGRAVSARLVRSVAGEFGRRDRKGGSTWFRKITIAGLVAVLLVRWCSSSPDAARTLPRRRQYRPRQQEVAPRPRVGPRPANPSRSEC